MEVDGGLELNESDDEESEEETVPDSQFVRNGETAAIDKSTQIWILSLRQHHQHLQKRHI